MAHDALDRIIALGIRPVWLEDFDEELVFVRDCNVALIDFRISRTEAARSLRDLLGISCSCLERREPA